MAKFSVGQKILDFFRLAERKKQYKNCIKFSQNVVIQNCNSDDIILKLKNIIIFFEDFFYTKKDKKIFQKY